MRLRKPAEDLDATLRPDQRQTLSGAQYLLIAVAAAHYILATMGANYWQLVHPERVLVVAAALVILACGAALILTRLGVASTTAFFVVLLATVLLVRGGPLLWRVSFPLNGLGIVAVLALAWYLTRRLPESAIWVSGVVLVVAIASGAVIDTYLAASSMGESRVVASPEPKTALATKPDIYLVFVDAYPGLRALSDLFDEPKLDLRADLEELGFQVPSSAWTSYPFTELALPAILEMSYPVEPDGLSDASREDLFAIVSGDNNTTALLAANGYQHTMIESGWVGSSCGDRFDTCVSSNWLDEVMFNVAWNSIFTKTAVAKYGHAFTANALSSMDSVRKILKDDSRRRPQFVFAHVLAPHPPFFLDERCELAVDRTRAESSLNPMFATELSDGWFLQQTECVDSFIRELGESTDDDDVVIVLGDHGTRRHSIPANGARPEDEAVLELMNVFLAVRLGCELTDPILTSDLMRQVFSCLATDSLEPVPERMFLSSGYEMSAAEIAEIMAFDR